MTYHNTLRRVKYLVLAWVLFLIAYFVFNHYLTEFPSWVISAGTALIFLAMFYPIFKEIGAKAKDKKEESR